jgi:3-phenylpropionate/cinnamic acid dioxygenase small subunit
MLPKQTTTDTTNKLLFLLEAQLFHGLKRHEALMLWNDEMDILHDRVETITTSERGL